VRESGRAKRVPAQNMHERRNEGALVSLLHTETSLVVLRIQAVSVTTIVRADVCGA
jgi:hypothetical protein